MAEAIKNNDLIDDLYLVTDDQRGQGGFGKVVTVRRLSDNALYALKYCTHTETENVRRFEREVRIMESIDHENVIKIVHSNLQYNPPYFVMPLAKASVADLIPDLKGDIEKVLLIFESICKGVSAVHNSGYTHRDLKPENALVYDDDRIVVSDLGLAKFDERDSTILTRASIAIATEGYAPPEQYEYGGTRDLDHRGDIYQLGKTLYRLITGYHPSLMDPNAVHPSLWYVIQKATQRNADRRYQTVGELLDALFDAKRASDPSLNPRGVFGQLISQTKEKLEVNQYDPEVVSKMLNLVYATENKDDYIDMFHEIPLRILQVYAGQMATEFQPVMEKYCDNVQSQIGGYPFHKADIVSRSMKVVFSSTEEPEIKRFAVLSVLSAAVDLNRYASMDDFDTMISSIKEDRVAFAVADGLRDNINLYRYLNSRIPKKELHPAIQVVWELCEKDV